MDRSFNHKKLFFGLALACIQLLSTSCVNISGNSSDPVPTGRMYSSRAASSSGGEVGTQVRVKVVLADQQGNGFSGITPQITAVDSGGSSAAISSSSCGTSDFSGAATCYISSNVAGTFTLVVTSPTQFNGGSVTFTQIARGLKFSVQPACGGSCTSSTVFTTTPIVQVVDNVGTLISSDTGRTITLALTTANSATLSGTKTSVTASGVSTFPTSPSDLKIDLSGSYTITATASGLTSATSSSITVVAGAANKLIYTTQPSSSSSANTVFAQQPVVSIEDVAGNIVTTTSCTITLSLTGGASGDSLLGTLAKTSSSGVASFASANLHVNSSAGGVAYHLLATPSGSVACSALTTASSSVFAITLSGVPYQLSITQQPSTASLNQIWGTQPILQVLDINGNLVSTDNSTAVTVTATPVAAGTGVLAGSTTVAVVNGIATFGSLEFTGTTAADAGTYTLTFTASNPYISSTFTTTTTELINNYGITPAKIVFQQQPTTVSKGGIFNPSITVLVEDANGYPCTNDSATTISIALSPCSGCLSGSGISPATLTDVNGVATFSNLTVSTAGSYNLTATATSIAGTPLVKSGTFGVTSYGNPNNLLFSQQPASASAAPAVFDTQPKVTIRDSSGNTVAGDNSTVITLSCSVPTGCSLHGTLSATAVNGVATFTGLYFPATTTAATLHATAASDSNYSGISIIATDSNSFSVP